MILQLGLVRMMKYNDHLGSTIENKITNTSFSKLCKLCSKITRWQTGRSGPVCKVTKYMIDSFY